MIIKKSHYKKICKATVNKNGVLGPGIVFSPFVNQELTIISIEIPKTYLKQFLEKFDY